MLGAYDSADNITIQQHISWAQYAGIDTFICSWWGIGSYEDTNFAKDFRYTMDNNINFSWSIYFESAQPQYQTNASEIARQIEYICNLYGNLPCFLQVEGRSVIFCYAITYEGEGVWTFAIQQLHAAGYNPFLIGDVGGLGFPDSGWLSIFDGIHIYSPVGILHDNGDYSTGYKQMIFATQAAGCLGCYTVCPGYDDFGIRTP